MSSPECIFCDKDNPEVNRIIAENNLAYARWDNFPVSDGHAEILPIRHIESMFDLLAEEFTAIQSLTNVVADLVWYEFQPTGFNIGINEGIVAGRTIHHVHQHFIPRYGTDENTGHGIESIMPGKGEY